MFLLLVMGVISCSSSSSTVDSSDVAQLSSFYLASQDSFPGFEEATFKISEGTDTGLVYAVDSIRYGTPLELSIPKFVFAATPASATLTIGDTMVVLTGSDTLDLSQKPIYLNVVSYDLTNTKVYRIEMDVHQVDPDLFVWTKLTDAVYDKDDSEQNVFVLDDTFYLFTNNGYGNRLFASMDGENWMQLALMGLPSSCHVKAIVDDGQTLYYAQDTILYTSTDAAVWTAHSYIDSSFTIPSMLMYYNDTVWTILEDKATKQLCLGKLIQGKVVNTWMKLDDDFPISGFYAVEFYSSSWRRRAMIIGGYTRNGRCLNSRWNVEYSPTDQTHPYRFINYSIEQPSFSTLTGVSVIWYNNQLMMFGGVDKDMVYRGNEILVSYDEGFNWEQIDSTKCALPASYTARQKQSVLVYENSIYVIGGQDRQTTYSDVYCGRLNSIDWEE